MRKINAFTWVLIFFLVVGFISMLLTNFTKMIVPIIIFALIFYFLKNPRGLDFLKKGNTSSHNDSEKRRNSFTVIDGKFKDVNKDK